MRRTLLLIMIAFAGAVLYTTTAGATNQVDDWCADGGAKYDNAQTPFVVPAPPAGKTWTLLVIKAGHGPDENAQWPNPSVGAGYSHPSGKDNSHAILCWTGLPPTTLPATTLPSTTPSTAPVTTVPETTVVDTTAPTSTTRVDCDPLPTVPNICLPPTTTTEVKSSTSTPLSTTTIPPSTTSSPSPSSTTVFSSPSSTPDTRRHWSPSSPPSSENPPASSPAPSNSSPDQPVPATLPRTGSATRTIAIIGSLFAAIGIVCILLTVAAGKRDLP